MFGRYIMKFSSNIIIAVATNLLAEQTSAFSSSANIFLKSKKNIYRNGSSGCKILHRSINISSLSSISSEAMIQESSCSQTAKPVTFESPKFSVYIEDTDAYGVMYNSNYLRAFERALSHVPRVPDEIAEPTQLSGQYDNINRRWVLSSIANQKFRSSPALGEEYVVRGDLIESQSKNGDENADVETWQLELVTMDDESNHIVHNSAQVTLSRSNTFPNGNKSQVNVPDDIAMSGKNYEKKYTPYHDEFDSHHHSPFLPSSEVNNANDNHHPHYHLPLRNAMNMFERSRSDYLGGPKNLRKMQIEDDLLWVVTGVDDGKLFLDSLVLEHTDDVSLGSGSDVVEKNLPKETMHENERVTTTNINDTVEAMRTNKNESLVDTFASHPTPGRELTVQTCFVPKRRGMIVECQHRLWMDVIHDSNNGERSRRTRRLLAQSTVTIMALKGSTRRPTSKLPQQVVDIFA